ncbi:MAG TPA: hypothetical protein PK156_24105 [Polyangium sp.]|nr:hypothetical protein [Polyangium sp.]
MPLVAIVSCVAVVSCQRTPLQSAHASSAIVELPAAPDAKPATTLSEGGCTVNLPGRWKRIRDVDESSAWDTESEDGSYALTVLPVPQNATDIQDGIDAILDTRREVDKEQNGPDIVLSEKEVFKDSGWYTAHNTSKGSFIATMAKASPKLACAVFLWHEGDSLEDFRRYAQDVLQGIRTER